MEPDILDSNTPEEEKKIIEKAQRNLGQNITEADEAADSAEGMDNMEDHIFEDVKEDRRATTDPALDIPDSDIIR